MKVNSKYLTIEEVISLPEYQETAVSEDGNWVAYVKKSPDWEDNKYRKHVWIYDVKMSTSYPVTVGKNESMQPHWSLDSKSLAYLSPTGEDDKRKNQIFVHSPYQAETIQISHAEISIESYFWDPNDNGFYFLANLPESKKAKQRKEMYGEFTYIDKDFQYNGLYFLPFDTCNGNKHALYNLPKDLHEIEQDNDCENNKPIISLVCSESMYIKSYDISPDGQTIALSATPTPGNTDFFEQEIYTLNIENKKLTKLDVSPLHVGEVLFSYDGLKICYRRFEHEKNIFNNTTLEMYDLKTKELTLLPLGIDENVLPVRWTKKGILVTWQEKTNIKIGLYTEDGNMIPLNDSDDIIVTNPSITTDGENVAYTKATSQKVVEVYLNDRPVTKQYKYYDGKIKSQKEIIHWKTGDGLDIDGILSKPVNYDASKSYPLVVVVHGGPAGTSFAIPSIHKYQPVEQFVEKGFLVLEPNYRGSAGYGEAFRKANYRKLGLGDYEDVISGVNFLVEKGIVDQERIGIMGWSQGGYISAFCATYSNRFKAISVGAGITNWITYYANTDITHFTRFYLGDTPWNDEDIYRKTSPMTYINSASTPTLIQHGEEDPRVPVPNARELYRGLKDVGVETELVIFKGMKHGSDKPGIHRAILKQNLDWFSFHVLGESIKDDAIYK